MEKVVEIGRILATGALNDTKKIRKASADMFLNVGPEKPDKHKETDATNRKMNSNKNTKFGGLLRPRMSENHGSSLQRNQYPAANQPTPAIRPDMSGVSGRRARLAVGVPRAQIPEVPGSTRDEKRQTVRTAV